VTFGEAGGDEVDQNILKVLGISNGMYLLETREIKQKVSKEDFEGRIREIIRESFTEK
jgi:hypothetical protein